MPDPKQKLVKVDDSIVAFPDSMPDANIAAVIKTFRESDKHKKQTHFTTPRTPVLTTEESEHARQIGNVPSVSPDWSTLRQAVSKATEPTPPNPNTVPVDSSFAANRDAAWNAAANAANVGGNIVKRAARLIFGVADLPPQVYGILKNLASPDSKVSEQAETDLLNLHPGAQIADRLKEAVQDWRKSKSLATENVLGDMLGFFLLDKAGGKLSDARIKQLKAEGVVLPPEASQKAPAAMPGTPPTIEGKFEPSAPAQVVPVEAAARMQKVQTPAELKSEALKLKPPEEPTKYKYGNTQADIPTDSDAGKALVAARTSIAPQDLAGKGVETTPHITVRYGIDGEDTAGIKAYLEKQPPFQATLGKTTAFPPSENSDGAAPIVVAIQAPELNRMEQEIDQHGNFIDRTFPEYKPHATLAYVKPEAAQKYVGMKNTEGKKFTVNSVTISKKDGTTEEVPLKGEGASPAELKKQAEALRPISAPMNLRYTGAQGAQPFYLKSDRILADKMKGPMPASDVQKMLLANGVKEEEMKYTGLDDFLKEKGNSKVTPQEINDFNATHDLQIQEVHKGMGQPPGPEAYGAIENWGDSQGYGNDVRNALSFIRAGDAAQGTGNLEMMGAPDDLLEPFRNYAQGEGGAKYSPWQMAGGKNYREMVMTLPQKAPEREGVTIPVPHPDLPGYWAVVKPDGEFVMAPQPASDNKSGAMAFASEQYANNFQLPRQAVQPFKTTHWDEPNVLAHVRFNDRTGPNGERLIHIEELQSDAHQKGRKYRYVDPKKPFAVTGVSGQFATREEAEQAAAANHVPKGFVRDERMERPEGVIPDFPFKKTWPELLVKRMLKYAVDNGYDGITYTPGREQADRYNLAKYVDKVVSTKRIDGTYHLFVEDKQGNTVINNRYDANELPELIGKDMAEKIVEESKKNPYQVFTGLDLQIGGEGQIGFYDVMVPNIVNKIAKKFGTKVGETQVVEGYPKEQERLEQVAKKAHDDYTQKIVALKDLDIGSAKYNKLVAEIEETQRAWETAETALRAIGRSSSKTVPYLPITPQMREGIKAQPFALFKLLYKSPQASEVQISDAWRRLGDMQRELDKIPPPKDPPVTSSPEQIEKWKAEYKDWAEKVAPWLQGFQQASKEIESLKNAGIGQIRKLPSGEKVLYLNRAGLNALYHGMSGKAPGNYTLSGLALDPTDVRSIVGNLMVIKPPLYDELTNLILRAMDKGGVTISMIPRKGQSLREALATLREELNHGWQKKFANAAGNHLSPERFAELNQAMPQAMSDHIHQNYPEIRNDGSETMNRRRVLEASSKMLSEPPIALGLTEDEWAAYLFQYFHAVEQEHGAKALDNLIHITHLAKEVKNDYFKAQGRNAGGPESSGSLRNLQEGRNQSTEGTSPKAERGIQAGTGTSLASLKREASTLSPEFKRWFGNSKVVDENGAPKVLYHGTTRKNPKILRKSFEAGNGIFLTDNEDVASTFTLPREYGEPVYEDEEGNEIEPGDVVPVYARIENPLVLEGEEAQKVSDDTALQARTLNAAKEAGHDGVILRNVKEGIGETYRGDTYVVFDSTQVKSTENKGTYDLSNPNITMRLTKNDQMPWEMTRDEIEQKYPKVPVGSKVDGRTVRKGVPNQSSIDAEMNTPTVLPGIREVSMSEFDAPPIVNEQTKALAEQIKQSGELNPLIVVIDKEGAYILEGGHRYDALKILGAKSIPAMVVLDEDSLRDATKEAVAAGKKVSPRILSDYPELNAKPSSTDVKSLLEEARRRDPRKELVTMP